MAPEVLNHQNWDYSVDFYALGVILYEFIMKKKPYKGKTRKEIKDQVMAKEAFIDKKDLPKNWSENARDLVNKLLVRNPEDRIGYLGIEEIFTHSWFDDMEWDKLENKELIPPYSPNIQEDNFNERHVNKEDKWLLENKITFDQSKRMLKQSIIQEQFKGYGYNPLNN
mmetsp:Transcript_28828/g.25510  ORF Transcript_28828/g.25510 Transcript_28828/m.25510 type:complete len:168 (+) Transcript_28828:124-627(+)